MKDLNMNEMCELAGLTAELTEEVEDLEEQEVGTESTIKALRDTDYRDKEAFFKMTELLKGLAVASEKDDKAKQYLSAVSDALTSAAKKVLGEAAGEVDDLGIHLGYGHAKKDPWAAKLSGSLGMIRKSIGLIQRHIDKGNMGDAKIGVSDILGQLARGFQDRVIKKALFDASDLILRNSGK
jgi:hypothetical protein